MHQSSKFLCSVFPFLIFAANFKISLNVFPVNLVILSIDWETFILLNVLLFLTLGTPFFDFLFFFPLPFHSKEIDSPLFSNNLLQHFNFEVGT